jgi:hypothetical protein
LTISEWVKFGEPVAVPIVVTSGKFQRKKPNATTTPEAKSSMAALMDF